MAGKNSSFMEWKEEFVSQERGHRVVHYFLKDSAGESTLAVIGTERSVRHMFYAVSDDFVRAYGAENSIHSGFKWRSRREVVEWLTSMLSKQHRNDWPKSPKHNSETPNGKLHPQKCVFRNVSGQNSDIIWSGDSWSCNKQLKHYPAFCRNGTRIATQSFVYVMAAKGKTHYLAYVEDMYEDKRSMKKVKVRWFHHSDEVKGIAPVRALHPKEVFITQYSQVISAECVNGPATVLKREHFKECASFSTRVHLCFRQFRSSKIKPFDIAKLRGYFDQPILAFLSPDTCVRNGHPRFHIDEKVEILSQDSGIRGCWFRCTVVVVGRTRLKVQYDDVLDEDEYGNLEEWVTAWKVASPDKLGMRVAGRQTIRPAPVCPKPGTALEVGVAVDVWWSDAWWEGVVSRTVNCTDDDSVRIYFPGESFFLNVARKDVRVSRDWVGGKWVEIEKKPEAFCEPLIVECKGKIDGGEIVTASDSGKMEIVPLAA